MDIPVYLFTGFLEGGKTTLIKETLEDPEFHSYQKPLVICCEEGIEEYDEKTDVVYVENLSQLSTEYYASLEEKYHPNFIMVELNGTWNVDKFMDVEMPENWILVQILSLVDASTFNLYIQNMSQMIFDQLKYSQVIIFNRCDQNTNKRYIRTNIKTINKQAELVYEDINGNIIELSEDDLPFDLNQNPLVIEDDDYGLWYLDVVDHPQKYEDKRIVVKGLVMHSEKADKNMTIFGRYAMVCCADDARPIGLIALSIDQNQFKKGDWIEVTGRIHCQYDELNDELIIVMETESFKQAKPMEDPYVYFS